MIDHININVSDFDGARAFYTQALAPLGVEVIMEFPGTAGLGNAPASPTCGSPSATSRARRSTSRSPRRTGPTVDAFYDAALEAGGTDNGAPGPRPQYHENYYGAFVLDPDGNNIEAVCHRAPE